MRSALLVKMVPFSRWLVFGAIVLAGTGWDLWSKWSVFSSLGYPGQTDWETSNLGGNLQFSLVTSLNEGALWGLGQGYSGLFAGLSVVASLAIVYWLFFRGAAWSWWLTIALAFVQAGTLGNLYDRLGLHGIREVDGSAIRYAVRDFLHARLFGFYEWPTFNFADTFLVTGAIMLLVYSLFWGDQMPNSASLEPITPVSPQPQ